MSRTASSNPMVNRGAILRAFPDRAVTAVQMSTLTGISVKTCRQHLNWLADNQIQGITAIKRQGRRTYYHRTRLS